MTQTNNEKKWYIVQTITNYEQRVMEELKNRDFNTEEGEEMIEEIYLPMIDHTTKTGMIKKKPMFPGYIYVKVEMTDESWFIIRNTQYVTGIVGSSGQRAKPTPIPESQIEKIKQQVEEHVVERENIQEIHSEEKQIKKDLTFEVGDVVNIKLGEFSGSVGTVKEISTIKQTATVEITFAGRRTPVELPFDHLDK